MATLINKRKLAAVSREALEGSRGRNVLDPKLTQVYISQVSEEIEWRVSKKLSKEFNKTESRILGALSKLDEFLPNPQVRTCSVIQGAYRNANSENREIHGDRSSNDPYPEGGYFLHHSWQLNSSEADMVTEHYPHMVTGATGEIRHYPHMVTGATEAIYHNRHMLTATQEEIPTAPLLLRQANRRRRAPQVNHNFAVRILLRQLKQNRFCWPFNNWRRTPIQPIWTIILAESGNCLNLWQRRCLLLTEKQRNSNFLKIFFKRVWKSSISWRKKTR